MAMTLTFCIAQGSNDVLRKAVMIQRSLDVGWYSVAPVFI